MQLTIVVIRLTFRSSLITFLLSASTRHATSLSPIAEIALPLLSVIMLDLSQCAIVRIALLVLALARAASISGVELTTLPLESFPESVFGIRTL